MSAKVTIGKIVGTHGMRGGLKVLPFSDNPDRVYELGRVYLSKDGCIYEQRVEKAFEHGKFWVINLQGADSLTAASVHMGAFLQIPADERPVLPEGRYYFDQIVGLDVYTKEGRLLGRIADILTAGGNDVYVVKTTWGDDLPRDILVPAAREIVLSVDLAQNRMVVDLPEGLL